MYTVFPLVDSLFCSFQGYIGILNHSNHFQSKTYFYTSFQAYVVTGFTQFKIDNFQSKDKINFFSVSTNQSIFEDQPVSLAAVLMLPQGSISPTFYAQLLHLQIPKAQKR